VPARISERTHQTPRLGASAQHGAPRPTLPASCWKARTPSRRSRGAGHRRRSRSAVAASYRSTRRNRKGPGKSRRLAQPLCNPESRVRTRSAAPCRREYAPLATRHQDFVRCATGTTHRSIQRDAQKMWSSDRLVSTSKLNALPRLHTWPIDLVVSEVPLAPKGLDTLFWSWLHAYMLSAFIQTERSYSAMLLAEQLIHQRFVHPNPLVLRTALLKYPTPTVDRDRPVSRRSKPSSRTAINRRTAEPLGPPPAPGCDEPTSRCQTFPSM
jgi:hypothetical protein